MDAKKPELVALIEQLKSGHMEYFDRFYEQTKKEVFYNIFAILKDYQLSEDILQDTYLKFLGSLAKIQTDNSPVGYLFVISRNLALSLIEKRKKETSLEGCENQSCFCEETRTSDRGLLDRVKELLSDKEFEIVVLHAIDGLPHREIAILQKRPLGTVLWAYSNAMKKLRKGLGEEYGR